MRLLEFLVGPRCCIVLVRVQPCLPKCEPVPEGASDHTALGAGTMTRTLLFQTLEYLWQKFSTPTPAYQIVLRRIVSLY